MKQILKSSAVNNVTRGKKGRPSKKRKDTEDSTAKSTCGKRSKRSHKFELPRVLQDGIDDIRKNNEVKTEMVPLSAEAQDVLEQLDLFMTKISDLKEKYGQVDDVDKWTSKQRQGEIKSQVSS